MKASKLIEGLVQAVAQLGDIEVEVATSPKADEWYEIFDVITMENHNGTFVCVLNTD